MAAITGISGGGFGNLDGVKKLDLVVCKIRSHQLDLMGKLASESTPVWWCVGNLFADALADRGAGAGALPAVEVTRLRQVLDVVCLVQKRLVTLGMHMVKHGLPRAITDVVGVLWRFFPQYT